MKSGDKQAKTTAGPREKELMDRIQLTIGGRRGFRLWRNNVGAAKVFRGPGMPPGFISFGLCPGSSDLIGMMPGGRFLAIEVKRPGEAQTEDQLKFEAAVCECGGLYILATSVEEAVAAVDAAQAKDRGQHHP